MYLGVSIGVICNMLESKEFAHNSCRLAKVWKGDAVKLALLQLFRNLEFIRWEKLVTGRHVAKLHMPQLARLKPELNTKIREWVLQLCQIGQSWRGLEKIGVQVDKASHVAHIPACIFAQLLCIMLLNIEVLRFQLLLLAQDIRNKLKSHESVKDRKSKTRLKRYSQVLEAC